MSCPIPGVTTDDDAFSFHTLERATNVQKSQVIHRKELADSVGIDVRLSATVVNLIFEASGIVKAVEIVRPDGSQRTRLPVRNLVIAAGGLESTRLLLAAQRDAPNRFGGTNGPLGRYYMGHVIGDIAKIVLSNAAVGNGFDYFVDTYGSYVRRRFLPKSVDTTAREDSKQCDVSDNPSSGRCQTR